MQDNEFAVNWGSVLTKWISYIGIFAPYESGWDIIQGSYYHIIIIINWYWYWYIWTDIIINRALTSMALNRCIEKMLARTVFGLEEAD